MSFLSSNKREISKKAFGPLPGSEPLDQFTSALVATSSISSVIENLSEISQLPQVLKEVSFRLGRISNLSEELNRLERKFILRRKVTEQERTPFVEVEFSSMKRTSKFFVRFEIHVGYPFGYLNFSFENLFGSTEAQEVEQAISTVRSKNSVGFGRLTRLCLAIDQLLC